MIQSGKVLSVQVTDRGDTLIAPVAVGDTILHLADLGGDFNADGGHVQVGGLVLPYASADTETNTIALSSPCPIAVDADEPVLDWDATAAAPVRETTAVVELAEGPQVADVPHSLATFLAEGEREFDAQESVLVRDEGGDLEVIEVVGKKPRMDVEYAPRPHLIGHLENDLMIDSGVWSVSTLVATHQDTMKMRHFILLGLSWVDTVVGGLFQITAGARFAPNPNGRRRVRAVYTAVDGTETIGWVASTTAEASGPTSVLMVDTHQFGTERGDIRIEFWQDSGGPLALLGSPTGNWTKMSVSLLSS